MPSTHPTQQHRRQVDAIVRYARDMAGDEVAAGAAAVDLDAAVSSADLGPLDKDLDDFRGRINRGEATPDDAVRTLASRCQGFPLCTSNRSLFERIVRRALKDGTGFARAFQVESAEVAMQPTAEERLAVRNARRDQQIQYVRNRGDVLPPEACSEEELQVALGLMRRNPKMDFDAALHALRYDGR